MNEEYIRRIADVLVSGIFNRRSLSHEDQAAYAAGMLREFLVAQRERDAGLADDVAKEYSATNAVDEVTADYLTGAETSARRIAAAIRAQS